MIASAAAPVMEGEACSSLNAPPAACRVRGADWANNGYGLGIQLRNNEALADADDQG
jgi:hypothetical protein